MSVRAPVGSLALPAGASFMRITEGEILDRLSILLLKACHQPEIIPKIRPELTSYLSEFRRCLRIWPLLELLQVNGSIWKLEAAIRNGQKLPLAEVGRRALAIRDLNRRRVAVRNKVSRYKDIKIDHASE